MTIYTQLLDLTKYYVSSDETGDGCETRFNIIFVSNEFFGGQARRRACEGRGPAQLPVVAQVGCAPRADPDDAPQRAHIPGTHADIPQGNNSSQQVRAEALLHPARDRREDLLLAAAKRRRLVCLDGRNILTVNILF
jgi:hypothetical protein